MTMIHDSDARYSSVSYRTARLWEQVIRLSAAVGCSGPGTVMAFVACGMSNYSAWRAILGCSKERPDCWRETKDRSSPMLAGFRDPS